jgi:hypothetical protein
VANPFGLLAEESCSAYYGPNSNRAIPSIQYRSCSIYRTRPNACLGMIPGGSQCDDCRRRAGLPPLENTEEGKALEKEMED